MDGLTFQERIHKEDGKLGIASVTLSDAGMYQCLAENEHGAIYASAELKAVGKSCILRFAMHTLHDCNSTLGLFRMLTGQ